MNSVSDGNMLNGKNYNKIPILIWCVSNVLQISVRHKNRQKG